ncbi:hypothetical protein ACP70R_029365 [Stipagrostis hirtigluma subsp. patula]
MSDDEGPMASGGPISPTPASPPVNDDALSQILLRLPPAPSSLPRVSLVCKRWRRLVTDPAFLRLFGARHRRSAPLLGFFKLRQGGVSFTPALRPPDRIPPERLSLRLDDVYGWRILCCRHGLVLLLHLTPPLHLLVWDPLTGEQRRVSIPPGFYSKYIKLVFNGAVLRGAGDINCGGHPSPFQVVLIGSNDELTPVFACVYSSETGAWGKIVSAACPSMRPVHLRSTLIGGSLYWFLDGDSVGILEFDLDRHCLAVIEMPLEMADEDAHFRVMRAEGGGLGFLCLSEYNIQLWKRKIDCDGDAGWVLGRTIELHKLLSLTRDREFSLAVRISGFVEDDNVLFLSTNVGRFVIQLDTLQLKKPFGTFCDGYPFASVYNAGMGIGAEQDRGELLHNTQPDCLVSCATLGMAVDQASASSEDIRCSMYCSAHL